MPVSVPLQRGSGLAAVDHLHHGTFNLGLLLKNFKELLIY